MRSVLAEGSRSERARNERATKDEANYRRPSMGVPAFFKWLSTKYGKIIVDCVEERHTWSDAGARVPVDTSQPNPNGQEYDNLYLDMNGVARAPHARHTHTPHERHARVRRAYALRAQRPAVVRHANTHVVVFVVVFGGDGCGCAAEV